MARINFKRINMLALEKSEQLMAEMSQGKRAGNEWLALNPHREDRSLGSLKINLRSGKWAEFATGEKGGDLISFVAFLKGCSQLDAAKFIKSHLGV